MKSRDNMAVVEKKCESQLFQVVTVISVQPSTCTCRPSLPRRSSASQCSRSSGITRSGRRWPKYAGEGWPCLYPLPLARSLSVVSGQLAPCLASLTSGEEKLARLAGGVARVQHHLLVQGVTVGEAQAAQVGLTSLTVIPTLELLPPGGAGVGEQTAGGVPHQGRHL